jgi:hypothetical protein
MSPTCLRVRDWNKHFENNRTRELKKLDWVPMPNKHDGDGYSELLDHPNGVAHYGAWCLIAQVASKCEEVAPKCGGRGTLLREGAKPYDAASLARVTRGDRKVFEEAIPRLIAIGWLECIPLQQIGVTPNPAPACDIPAPPCGKVPIEGKGREENGTEGKEDVPPPAAAVPDLFPGTTANFQAEKIYAEYPKKVGKPVALRAIKRALKGNSFDFLMEKTKAFATMRNGDRAFCPNPSTWFNEERFNDDPSTWVNGHGHANHRDERRAREYPQEIKAKILK